MINFEDKMFSIINALYKSKLLEKCIISGSWAMYFYKEIFEDFIPPIATTDFDIFLPKISSIKDGDINSLLIDMEYLRDDDYLSAKQNTFRKMDLKLNF